MPPVVSCPAVTINLHTVGYQASYQAKHHAVFDIHHLLMDFSLIAVGKSLAFLLSHWVDHREGPPTDCVHTEGCTVNL